MSNLQIFLILFTVVFFNVLFLGATYYLWIGPVKKTAANTGAFDKANLHAGGRNGLVVAITTFGMALFQHLHDFLQAMPPSTLQTAAWVSLILAGSATIFEIMRSVRKNYAPDATDPPLEEKTGEQ